MAPADASLRQAHANGPIFPGLPNLFSRFGLSDILGPPALRPGRTNPRAKSAPASGPTFRCRLHTAGQASGPTRPLRALCPTVLPSSLYSSRTLFRDDSFRTTLSGRLAGARNALPPQSPPQRPMLPNTRTTPIGSCVRRFLGVRRPGVLHIGTGRRSCFGRRPSVTVACGNTAGTPAAASGPVGRRPYSPKGRTTRVFWPVNNPFRVEGGLGSPDFGRARQRALLGLADTAGCRSVPTIVRPGTRRLARGGW